MSSTHLGSAYSHFPCSRPNSYTRDKLGIPINSHTNPLSHLCDQSSQIYVHRSAAAEPNMNHRWIPYKGIILLSRGGTSSSSDRQHCRRETTGPNEKPIRSLCQWSFGLRLIARLCDKILWKRLRISLPPASTDAIVALPRCATCPSYHCHFNKIYCLDLIKWKGAELAFHFFRVQWTANYWRSATHRLANWTSDPSINSLFTQSCPLSY